MQVRKHRKRTSARIEPASPAAETTTTNRAEVCRESLTLIVRVLARQAARDTFLAKQGESQDAPCKE
jgi:hypothetical protein